MNKFEKLFENYETAKCKTKDFNQTIKCTILTEDLQSILIINKKFEIKEVLECKYINALDVKYNTNKIDAYRVNTLNLNDLQSKLARILDLKSKTKILNAKKTLTIKIGDIEKYNHLIYNIQINKNNYAQKLLANINSFRGITLDFYNIGLEVDLITPELEEEYLKLFSLEIEKTEKTLLLNACREEGKKRGITNNIELISLAKELFEIEIIKEVNDWKYVFITPVTEDQTTININNFITVYTNNNAKYKNLILAKKASDVLTYFLFTYNSSNKIEFIKEGYKKDLIAAYIENNSYTPEKLYNSKIGNIQDFKNIIENCLYKLNKKQDAENKINIKSNNPSEIALIRSKFLSSTGINKVDMIRLIKSISYTLNKDASILLSAIDPVDSKQKFYYGYPDYNDIRNIILGCIKPCLIIKELKEA